MVVDEVQGTVSLEVDLCGCYCIHSCCLPWVLKESYGNMVVFDSSWEVFDSSWELATFEQIAGFIFFVDTT